MCWLSTGCLWTRGSAAGRPQIGSLGEPISYHIRRVEEGSAREYDRTVTLTTFPLGRAVLADLPTVLAALMLLVSGSLAFFVRPDLVAAWAFLGFASLAPVHLASAPWGLGAVDLSGGRGYWPHVAAEVICAVGLGLALLAAATLRAPRAWLVNHPWAVPVTVLFPFAGYAAWATAVALATDGPTRTQGLLSVAAPSLVVVVPAVLLVLVLTYLRADSREVRLAARLVMLVLVAGLGLRVLLGDLPERLTGNPVLPRDVLMLLIVPPVLAGVVVALVGYRLDDIEPAVRRTVVQGAVAAVFGTAFVVVASTIGRAADVPVGSILAGGVIALLVLPVAVALQRGVRRRVYGDRELPRSVVAELHRLDVATPPSEALTETLTVLSRRLRVSHATIEARAADGGEPLVASVGEPRGGSPVVVDLVAGGSSIGSLYLEADPVRDPFGRGERRLLEDVAAQVGALVQAVLVNRELQRSRQQLVTAREEERRRLRRDLHDGLGPSLATMAMRLESVQDLVSTDPDQATEVLEVSRIWPVTTSRRYVVWSTACAPRPSTSWAWSQPCDNAPNSTGSRSGPKAWCGGSKQGTTWSRCPRRWKWRRTGSRWRPSRTPYGTARPGRARSFCDARPACCGSASRTTAWGSPRADRVV